MYSSTPAAAARSPARAGRNAVCTRRRRRRRPLRRLRSFYFFFVCLRCLFVMYLFLHVCLFACLLISLFFDASARGEGVLDLVLWSGAPLGAHEGPASTANNDNNTNNNNNSNNNNNNNNNNINDNTTTGGTRKRSDSLSIRPFSVLTIPESLESLKSFKTYV